MICFLLPSGIFFPPSPNCLNPSFFPCSGERKMCPVAFCACVVGLTQALEASTFLPNREKACPFYFSSTREELTGNVSPSSSGLKAELVEFLLAPKFPLHTQKLITRPFANFSSAATQLKPCKVLLPKGPSKKIKQPPSKFLGRNRFSMIFCALFFLFFFFSFASPLI